MCQLFPATPTKLKASRVVLASAQFRPGERRVCVDPPPLPIRMWPSARWPCRSQPGFEEPASVHVQGTSCTTPTVPGSVATLLCSEQRGVLEGLRMDTVLPENSDCGLQLLDLTSATSSAATVTGELLGNCNGATLETVFGTWGTEGFWPCTAGSRCCEDAPAIGLPLDADCGRSASTHWEHVTDSIPCATCDDVLPGSKRNQHQIKETDPLKQCRLEQKWLGTFKILKFAAQVINKMNFEKRLKK